MSAFLSAGPTHVLFFGNKKEKGRGGGNVWIWDKRVRKEVLDERGVIANVMGVVYERCVDFLLWIRSCLQYYTHG